MPSSGPVEIGWSYQASKPGTVSSQRLCHRVQDTDARPFGLAAPLVETAFGSFAAWLIPEQPQLLLEVVRRRQRLIELQCRFEFFAVARLAGFAPGEALR